LDRRQKRIAEIRTIRQAEIPAGPEREVIAFVLSLLDEDNKASGDIMAALIAMAAHDPEILGPVAQESYRQTITDLPKEGLSFEQAAVITLATYGLRFFEVLSVSYFNAKERRRIIKELLDLAKEPARHPQGADRVVERG